MSSNDQMLARLRATFLGELSEQVSTLNHELLGLESQPDEPERLRSVFRIAHTLKGAARAAAVPAVEQLCHELESLLAAARDGHVRLTVESFTLLFAAADALADAAARLRREEDLTDSPLTQLLARLRGNASGELRQEARRTTTPVAAPPSEPEPAAPAVQPEFRDAFIRVDPEKLDALLAATAEIMAAQAGLRSLPADVHGIGELAQRAARAWEQSHRAIRLGFERAEAVASERDAVDALELSIRELAVASRRLMLAQRREVQALARATDALGDQVRRLRMRPFAEACATLPRTVRDLALSAGKRVEVRMEGQEIEAERAVLDTLAEVLLQLVRNAVDHGIEPPAQRVARGKPERGLVTVGAQIRGDRLLVRVADDGAGVDLAAIRAQLAGSGQMVPDQDADVLRALFQPGISTRGDVTIISGRGVGLDIVQTAMTRIRGRVEVASVRGAGTTFTLDAPLTLANVHALLLRVSDRVLALPMAQVARVLRLRPEDVRRVGNRPVMVSGDAPIPVIALAQLLGPPFKPAPFVQPTPIVLLAAGSQAVALLVDDLVGDRELIVRPLDGGKEPPPHVSGAALLSQGGATLLLNPFTLLETALIERTSELPEAPDRPVISAERRVLVVDDSITTRTLEQSILEAAGYHVITAVDGADAWRILQEQGAELVVSDVEMPHMDGFELCRAIRGSKRFSQLPVILVSALESAEHRKRGLELGADAYLGKASFDQHRLLELVEQLIGQVPS